VNRTGEPLRLEDYFLAWSSDNVAGATSSTTFHTTQIPLSNGTEPDTTCAAARLITHPDMHLVTVPSVSFGAPPGLHPHPPPSQVDPPLAMDPSHGTAQELRGQYRSPRCSPCNNTLGPPSSSTQKMSVPLTIFDDATPSPISGGAQRVSPNWTKPSPVSFSPPWLVSRRDEFRVPSQRQHPPPFSSNTPHPQGDPTPNNYLEGLSNSCGSRDFAHPYHPVQAYPPRPSVNRGEGDVLQPNDYPWDGHRLHG